MRQVLAGFDLTFSGPKSVSVPSESPTPATLNGRQRSLKITGADDRTDWAG